MNVALLDPVLTDAIARYDASRTAARMVVAGLSDLEVHQRPPGGEWSVAHCIQHLVTAGSRMCAQLNDAIDRSRGRRADGPPRPHPPSAFRGDWLDRLFVRLTGPPGTGGKLPARAKAPAPFAPPADHVARAGEVILAEYLDLQDRLSETAHGAADVDLGIRVPSVVTGLIRVRLGAWFSAIAGHQERHLLQARRARAAIGR